MSKSAPIRGMPRRIRHASSASGPASMRPAATRVAATTSAPSRVTRAPVPGPAAAGVKVVPPIAGAPAGHENTTVSSVTSPSATSDERTYGSSSASILSGCADPWSTRSPDSSRTTVTSARIRPVGVRSSDRRARPGASESMSAVTRSWSHDVASAPVTRITRRGGRANAPSSRSPASSSCGASMGPMPGRIIRDGRPAHPRWSRTTTRRASAGSSARSRRSSTSCRPIASRCSVQAGTRRKPSTRPRPYRVLRQPERFLWPTPEVARRVEDAVRETGAEVVLFGATYPLAMIGPRLAARGIPYLAAAHGFEYWLSVDAGGAQPRCGTRPRRPRASR